LAYYLLTVIKPFSTSSFGLLLTGIKLFSTSSLDLLLTGIKPFSTSSLGLLPTYRHQAIFDQFPLAYYLLTGLKPGSQIQKGLFSNPSPTPKPKVLGENL
jgi:hypothetical protein